MLWGTSGGGHPRNTWPYRASSPWHGFQETRTPRELFVVVAAAVFENRVTVYRELELELELRPEDVSVKQTIKQKMNFPDSIPPTKIKTSAAN